MLLDDDLVKVKKPTQLSQRRNKVWLIVILVGFLFKLFNWPGTDFILLFSSGGLFASSLHFVIRSKSFNNTATLFVYSGVLFTALLIWGNVYNHGHPYNWGGLGIYAFTTILYFSIYWFIARKNKTISNF